MTTSYTVNGSTRTDTGQERSRNEDSVGAFQPDDPEVRELRGCLYVVADGMGGHAAGDVASSYAVQKILHDYYNLPWEGVEQTLLAAIKEANADIHDESNATIERSGMGCTTVAAAVTGNRAVIAHVGDSRAYLIRNGEIRQITRDHSWVAEKLAAGLITPEQAIDHPNRNVLTRNLGQLRTVYVDINQEELQPGDRLLLCTDGLWNEVRDDQIAALAQRRNPEDATAGLVDAANAAGGSDNIGVALIGFGPLSSIGITRRVNAGLPAPSFGPSTTTARTRRVAARPTAERRWLAYLLPWLLAFVACYLVAFFIVLGTRDGGRKQGGDAARASVAPSATRSAAPVVASASSCASRSALERALCPPPTASATPTAAATASATALASSAVQAPAAARPGSPTRTATSTAVPSRTTTPTMATQPAIGSGQSAGQGGGISYIWKSGDTFTKLWTDCYDAAQFEDWFALDTAFAPLNPQIRKKVPDKHGVVSVERLDPQPEDPVQMPVPTRTDRPKCPFTSDLQPKASPRAPREARA